MGPIGPHLQLHGCVVCEQSWALPDQFADVRGQRFQQGCGATDPVAQRGTMQIDPFACVDLGLLRAECGGTRQSSTPMEAPEGVVYCGGGGIKRQIEFVILDNPSDKWDARITVNGETTRAMTSYSYFGNSEPVKDFVVALLAENRSEFLIFRNQRKNWLELGDYQYD